MVEYMQLELRDYTAASLEQHAAQWKVIQREFEEEKKRLSFEDIAETYHLSPSTVKVMEEIVQGNRVSLAQVSEETLLELRSFKQFCEAITLLFSAPS